MGYELIEWWYAAADGGASGAEFLGSQGDVWDAQKDMLADTLGAIAGDHSVLRHRTDWFKVQRVRSRCILRSGEGRTNENRSRTISNRHDGRRRRMPGSDVRPGGL